MGLGLIGSQLTEQQLSLQELLSPNNRSCLQDYKREACGQEQARSVCGTSLAHMPTIQNIQKYLLNEGETEMGMGIASQSGYGWMQGGAHSTSQNLQAQTFLELQLKRHLIVAHEGGQEENCLVMTLFMKGHAHNGSLGGFDFFSPQ